ncbi:MAG: DinB family protein, partial [Geminicoccaceae bacterium]|nr:DinB family protein [Geminicoccaceae bacterium]
MMHTHLCRMARYNRWANRRLYDACAALDEDEYLRERGMFFGSIHGTLNHVLVGDLHWLARIENLDAPELRL